MDAPDYGVAAMRRGSWDDAAAGLRPHFRNLAQRRRSAPSLVFGKALGMPWSPIREEAACWASAEQSPFVLGLTSENGELLLDACVQITEGSTTKERHLFLFRNIMVVAKLKSTASYRLKHRVSLEEMWLDGFEDEPQGDEEDGGAPAEDVDLRVTVLMAWALTFCLVCFRSPEVKERWLDTLHRQIKDAVARVGCASSTPDVLMKVLSGSVTTKTLPVGGMEQFIEFPLDGDARTSAPSKQFHNQEDKQTQPIETKWNLVKRLRKGSSFISKARRSETQDAKPQLFGLPLCKICPDDFSLPKPVAEMLALLRKRGPSTEGVFRKPCNNKNMRDVREQLNAGLEVDLEGQPVVLLVGLLKSFLKELPGSLLVSELYDDWMTALDTEDAQRALEITKVVNKLPGANKLLLQHVACVLHHVLERADINKMDARNLAVCTAPTLLQLDHMPLDEQKDKMQKVTDLTQFLIEHCAILGENIPNLLDSDEDSLSSLHQDSAYDSTGDPDGDGEAGSTHRESCSSSSSLSPSLAKASWPADGAYNTNRRCSEPIILLSADLEGLCGGHARSHDDCSLERRSGFPEQPLMKQTSDDSFLLRRRGGKKLRCTSGGSNPGPLAYMEASRVKDCSCSSLESAASNQSEGSVFTSSPAGSPGCPRRATATNSQLCGSAQTQQELSRPSPDEKRRSASMRVATKVLMRTRSLGAFGRSSLRKGDSQKETPFPCGTLQEDSQSEADPPAELLHKLRPLSAIEVFKQVDSRLPCRPPSYEQAVQNAGLPPHYGSMTVHDAVRLERKWRPSSVNYDSMSTCSVNQYGDCFAQDKASVGEQRPAFRQRAMSESVPAGQHGMVSRRCSHPVFDDMSYAKESYV